MDTMIELAKSKLEHNKNILEKLNSRTLPRNRGSVFVDTIRGHDYFRKETYEKGHRKRSFLGDRDSKRVIEAKCEQMDWALCKLISENDKALEDFCKRYKPITTNSLEGEVSPCLVNIPCDYRLDKGMQRLFEWAEGNYQKNTMPFPKQVIRTRDGTRVRSKDECIWYDSLRDAGLPFRNDWLMELDDPWTDGGTVIKSPDFVIPTFDNGLILIEHAGLLNRRQYANDLMEKIQIYLYNGYTLGDNLFIHSDDINGGVNVRAIEFTIETIKARFFAI